jgi:hypothetical protein
MSTLAVSQQKQGTLGRVIALHDLEEGVEVLDVLVKSVDVAALALTSTVHTAVHAFHTDVQTLQGVNEVAVAADVFAESMDQRDCGSLSISPRASIEAETIAGFKMSFTVRLGMHGVVWLG